MLMEGLSGFTGKCVSGRRRRAASALWMMPDMLLEERLPWAQRSPAASPAVRGAVLMSCRRRYWRDATHEELKNPEVMVDRRPQPDQDVLAPECGGVLGSLYLRRLRVLIALDRFQVEDADLARHMLAGTSVEYLERTTPGAGRRLGKVVNMLKRRLGPRRQVKSNLT